MKVRFGVVAGVIVLLACAIVAVMNNRKAKIEGTRWLLTELTGQEMTAEGSRSVYFRIDPITRKVEGFAGCNRFFGKARVARGNRVRFADMGATQMACEQMDLERRLFDALERADHFTLVDGVLALNEARMAPLARFTAAKAP